MARTVRRPLSALRALAFWGAIVVPAAYLPLLYGGPDDLTHLALVGLVSLNVVCLVLGHGYSP